MERFHHHVLLIVPIFISIVHLCCARDAKLSGPVPAKFPVSRETILAGGGLDLATILMQSTFKIQGTTESDSLLFGTAFIFNLPCGGDDQKAILVTSAHLLDSLITDRALLGMRDRKWDGSWEERPWWIDIRRQDRPLWVRHDEADVAAMCIELPEFAEIPLSSLELLADEETFRKYEIGPGDELMCLGYSSQDGVHGSGGFPILRGGKIASYPLYPVKRHRTFRYDVEIFRGYSGGPVFFNQVGRIYGGISHPEEQIQFVAGLLTRQWFADKEERQPLKLAEVVHAHFIREIVQTLIEESR
jgi:hypothetical protein